MIPKSLADKRDELAGEISYRQCDTGNDFLNKAIVIGFHEGFDAACEILLWEMDTIINIIKLAQKYICENSHSCMKHEVLSTSHGPTCIDLQEALAAYRRFMGEEK